METVFILQHAHIQPDGSEEVKLIGVYRTRASAEAAANRIGKQPGFSNPPKVVEPNDVAEADGFTIDEYPLDKDHWEEGFITL